MIEVINLTKKYKKNVVLENVNITICSGQITFLMGENGAGKTSLIKSILDLEEYQGQVLFDNETIDNAYGDISAVFDDSPLYSGLCGYENIRLLCNKFLSKKESNSLALQLLNETELNQKVKRYSYGQRKTKSTVSNVNQYLLPEDAVLQSSVFTKLLVSVFIGGLFSIIGFSFGLVFKSAILPMVILAVYNFLIPSLGKYDLKNLVSVTGHRFFEFNGDLFCLFQPVEVKSIIAIGILLLIFASLGFTNLVIARKQSKYVV